MVRFCVLIPNGSIHNVRIHWMIYGLDRIQRLVGRLILLGGFGVVEGVEGRTILISETRVMGLRVIWERAKVSFISLQRLRGIRDIIL